MSSDYGTEHFKGYHHKDGVYVVWKENGEPEFGMIDPEMVSELQSIIDQWKSNQDLLRC